MKLKSTLRNVIDDNNNSIVDILTPFANQYESYKENHGLVNLVKRPSTV